MCGDDRDMWRVSLGWVGEIRVCEKMRLRLLEIGNQGEITGGEER